VRSAVRMGFSPFNDERTVHGLVALHHAFGGTFERVPADRQAIERRDA
jgi:hypothetical protein